MGETMRWTDRIERQVKLRDLHILLALVESGSMGRARHTALVRERAVPDE
jgi:hypothetical protein